MNLGPLDTIPRGEGRVFNVGANAIAVFHTRSGGVFATEPTCPHRAGPLADGIIGEHKVICPLHAFVFDLSNGEPIGNSCTALKTYPAAVNEQGDIVVVL
jgi:nitrite reductase (NADH) small subunit